MMLPASLPSDWSVLLVNHLWQSTAVVLLAWPLTLLLRRNPARVRFVVWMAASIKFLLPFSLLIAAGSALRVPFASSTPAPAFVYAADLVDGFSEPFAHSPAHSVATAASSAATPALPTHSVHLFLPALMALWLCGSLPILGLWLQRWFALRRIVRHATAVALPAEVPVFTTPSLLEPGVFGILRPVLLLPQGIAERLTAPQIATILAHEMCHVRRRDNLTATLHMLVVAAFWFHPAVWFLKARLLEERERACDEAVLQAGSEASLYAESILSVCRFYVESPLACISGITGANLRQRIVRIMTAGSARQLNVPRKLLLGVTVAFAITSPVLLGLVHIAGVHAQSQPVNTDPTHDLSDSWQGTLHAGKDLRLVLKITRTPGGYKALFYSIDQGADGIPVKSLTLDGTTVKIEVEVLNGTYEGKLSPDGKTITGTWTQGKPLPLILTRATPETAWAMPVPPPKLPPMAANADPTFEVATIKPSKPDAKGIGFRVNGRRFSTFNTPLSAIITFAYGIHPRQIVGAPAWINEDKYDIEATPDGEGAPSDRQWKHMMQKLLADRFKLTFHHDKKELSVYVLTVAKDGPKLTRSDGDPEGLPGNFFFKLGGMNNRNSTILDFTNVMQAAVLDRPIVDQTGIKGRYNFTLNWTPDDSQFGGMGVKALPPPPTTDVANAPPDLFKAVQEQLGLKLDATRAQTDVLVIDHVEKPSDN